ncbi:hypothetical protein HS7_12640 [Sulfolobales archaeon HS-7]|nr:hypothetical protein HS7_12640 [Sulfolobales archaeon HS-7]
MNDVLGIIGIALLLLVILSALAAYLYLYQGSLQASQVSLYTESQASQTEGNVFGDGTLAFLVNSGNVPFCVVGIMYYSTPDSQPLIIDFNNPASCIPYYASLSSTSSLQIPKGLRQCSLPLSSAFTFFTNGQNVNNKLLLNPGEEIAVPYITGVVGFVTSTGKIFWYPAPPTPQYFKLGNDQNQIQGSIASLLKNQMGLLSQENFIQKQQSNVNLSICVVFISPIPCVPTIYPGIPSLFGCSYLDSSGGNQYYIRPSISEFYNYKNYYKTFLIPNGTLLNLEAMARADTGLTGHGFNFEKWEIRSLFASYKYVNASNDTNEVVVYIGKGCVPYISNIRPRVVIFPHYGTHNTYLDEGAPPFLPEPETWFTLTGAPPEFVDPIYFVFNHPPGYPLGGTVSVSFPEDGICNVNMSRSSYLPSPWLAYGITIYPPFSELANGPAFVTYYDSGTDRGCVTSYPSSWAGPYRGRYSVHPATLPIPCGFTDNGDIIYLYFAEDNCVNLCGYVHNFPIGYVGTLYIPAFIPPDGPLIITEIAIYNNIVRVNDKFQVMHITFKNIASNQNVYASGVSEANFTYSSSNPPPVNLPNIPGYTNYNDSWTFITPTYNARLNYLGIGTFSNNLFRNFTCFTPNTLSSSVTSSDTVYRGNIYMRPIEEVTFASQGDSFLQASFINALTGTNETISVNPGQKGVAFVPYEYEFNISSNSWINSITSNGWNVNGVTYSRTYSSYGQLPSSVNNLPSRYAFLSIIVNRNTNVIAMYSGSKQVNEFVGTNMNGIVLVSNGMSSCVVSTENVLTFPANTLLLIEGEPYPYNAFSNITGNFTEPSNCPLVLLNGTGGTLNLLSYTSSTFEQFSQEVLLPVINPTSVVFNFLKIPPSLENWTANITIFSPFLNVTGIVVQGGETYKINMTSSGLSSVLSSSSKEKIGIPAGAIAELDVSGFSYGGLCLTQTSNSPIGVIGLNYNNGRAFVYQEQISISTPITYKQNSNGVAVPVPIIIVNGENIQAFLELSNAPKPWDYFEFSSDLGIQPIMSDIGSGYVGTSSVYKALSEIEGVPGLSSFLCDMGWFGNGIGEYGAISALNYTAQNINEYWANLGSNIGLLLSTAGYTSLLPSGEYLMNALYSGINQQLLSSFMDQESTFGNIINGIGYGGSYQVYQAYLQTMNSVNRIETAGQKVLSMLAEQNSGSIQSCISQEESSIDNIINSMNDLTSFKDYRVNIQQLLTLKSDVDYSSNAMLNELNRMSGLNDPSLQMAAQSNILNLAMEIQGYIYQSLGEQIPFIGGQVLNSTGVEIHTKYVGVQSSYVFGVGQYPVMFMSSSDGYLPSSSNIFYPNSLSSSFLGAACHVVSPTYAEPLYPLEGVETGFPALTFNETTMTSTSLPVLLFNGFNTWVPVILQTNSYMLNSNGQIYEIVI